MNDPTKCHLTDLPILAGSYANNLEKITYKLQFKGIFITLCDSCFTYEMQNNREFPKYKTILRSLILTGKIDTESIKFHWDRDNKIGADKLTPFNIKTEVETFPYPKTPKEKLENLFKSLYDLQEYAGSSIELRDFTNITRWGQWYFENYKEAFFYLKTLDQEGIIKLDERISYNTPAFNFTYAGLNKYIGLFEEGYNSKYCFVAMSFDKTEKLKEVRNAIKNALDATGFKPYIVDEKHLESEQTINDAIIAGLKQSKFCIADFCSHKNGVYFESGFALGQGKQVIYTCSSEEFQKTHFDTNHFQHIVYENAKDLHQGLVNKIQAWVK